MNDIVIKSNQACPSEHEMMVYHTMAEHAVSSKMYRGVGEKAGIMMIMLSARELGISPCQALNGGLNLINGKVEISARMMGALIRRAGHKFKTTESTQTGCTIVGIRGDTGESQSASFTVSEAQQAGIFKAGGGWTKWPKDMCYARALSRLARQLFQDVIGIGYVEGEIQESHAEIILPEEEPETVYPERSIEDFFKPEDVELGKQYFEVVRKHMGWDAAQTMKEFSKDLSELQVKFNKWKEKNSQ